MLRSTFRLYKPVKQYLVILLGFHAYTGNTQSPTLSLHEAFTIAEKNYPVSQRKDLLKQAEALTIKNINTGLLPQVFVNGQASYQSDVTKIIIPIPGVKIPVQPKDQYKAYADVTETIYDGGMIREQKVVEHLNTDVEESKVNVELNELKTRINQFYFAVLYQQDLQDQTELLLKNIQTGIDKIRPQVENGTMLRSNLLMLEAQKLQTAQREIEIKNSRKGLLHALSTLLNYPIDEKTQLEKPLLEFTMDTSIRRPEVTLYNNQMNLIQGQRALIEARNKPKISAFVQGGYGRPALNLLFPTFEFYYITGIRLNWSIGSLYTSKREKQILSVNQQSIILQKETFLLNTQSQLNLQSADIEKYIELIQSDEAIIDVRNKITEAAKAQLANAVITVNDYLREINEEDQVRQSQIIHQVQLLQAKANYAITAGKL